MSIESKSIPVEEFLARLDLKLLMLESKVDRLIQLVEEMPEDDLEEEEDDEKVDYVFDTTPDQIVITSPDVPRTSAPINHPAYLPASSESNFQSARRR